MFYNNNDNDLFAYFEVINQIRPTSCVDFGPFLKQSGCIARQAKDTSMIPNVMLAGVDFSIEPHLPVYETIYDTLISFDKLSELHDTYNLGIGYRLESFASAKDIAVLMRWINEHCKYFCTDMPPAKLNSSLNATVSDLNVEDQKFYIYTIMEH